MSVRLDALGLLFLALFLLLPAPGTPRITGLVVRLGLALTSLAGQTGGQALGLGVAACGLIWAERRAGRPAPAAFAPLPAPALLLPIALFGTFDARLLPGQPVPALPWPVVGLALAAAAAGVLSLRPASPTGEGWAALYSLGCLLPALRSLGAGPWDAWARLGALGLGLAGLGLAAWMAWNTSGGAARVYLAAAMLLGLGIGTPAAVAGGLVLLLGGHAGQALGAALGTGRLPRLVGIGVASGLPPTLGFVGLWLLLGATAAARLPLATALLSICALLVALSNARGLSPAGEAGWRIGPTAAWVVAAGLLAGGLMPAAMLDWVLRPALNTLAAGLPALSEVQEWPGVGLMLTRDNALAGVWPAVGVAATLAITLAGAELLARLTTHRAKSAPPDA
ncbi:MAG: hypothetical protein ACR2M0_14665 [Chloroflexia bacterium]